MSHITSSQRGWIMKRRKKTIVIIAVFLVVALLITGYIRFFNGKPVYFTMGMKDDELIKTTGQKVTYTCEAEILMSDVKKEYDLVTLAQYHVNY